MSNFICDNPWCTSTNRGSQKGRIYLFDSDQRASCCKGSSCACREKKQIDLLQISNLALTTASSAVIVCGAYELLDMHAKGTLPSIVGFVENISGEDETLTSEQAEQRLPERDNEGLIPDTRDQRWDELEAKRKKLEARKSELLAYKEGSTQSRSISALLEKQEQSKQQGDADSGTTIAAVLARQAQETKLIAEKAASTQRDAAAQRDISDEKVKQNTPANLEDEDAFLDAFPDILN